MSRIKWERARKLLDWQFAVPPDTWPVRFTPYQLARLQAHAGLAVDCLADTEISALKKAIEAAVKALEIPHIDEKFSFPSRVMSWGGTKEFHSQELPAIAATDFARWLEEQGETPSVHINAWFAAYRTAPATYTAPVVLPDPEPIPSEVVLDWLKTVVANDVPVETLLAELERLKVKFFTKDGSPFVQIPDGTAKGRRRPLTEIYAALSELFNTLPKSAVLGTLLRGSGASGGGATSSSHRRPTAPATTDVLVMPEVAKIVLKVDVPEAEDVWWKLEHDIFDMAQNIGAQLKANRNSHSNGAIAEEIAKRIKAIEFKKGKSRKTPSTATVRKMLNGWRLKPS